jgi:hypothetical protein
MKVADNIALIVGNPQGILDQQLIPPPIQLLNIIILLLNFIKLYTILLLHYLKNEEHPT